MLITYLRSSSLGTYELCEFRAWLSYSLGLSDSTGKSAVKGSIVHKSLEIMASKKKAIQEGSNIIYNEELDKNYTIDVSWKATLDDAYVFYKNKHPELGWVQSDYKDCVKWTEIVMNDKNFCPLNRNVLHPEYYFEHEITKDWGSYEYDIQGQTIKGNLVLRGTMDLITELNKDTLELIDWKSGAKKSWVSGEEKTFKTLRDDKQFRLYHYILENYFPLYKYKIVTVYYIKEGGPISVYFDKEDAKTTEEILKDKFLEIKSNKSPKLIWPSFKCKWCKFSEPPENSNVPTCLSMKNELYKIGMEKMQEKYLDLDKLNKYEGGGRSK